MAIECHVYDATNTTKLGELPLSFAREWRDDLMDIGYGSVSVPTGTADDALLQPDRVVRMRLDGVDRFAFLCSDGDQALIAPGEEAEQITTWSGPGLFQWFEESVVFPELGIGRLSSSTRVFNFASTSYDDSAWGSAVEIKRQGDITDPPYADAPDGWPDEDACWIWTRPRDLTPPGPIQPVGTVFFRKWFTVTDQTDAVMFVACDDGYEVWLDGELIAQEERAFLWGRTTEYGMVLDAGDHLIAVKATNIERDNAATNGAALILSILAAGDGGRDLDPDALVRTDDSWAALDYPDPWPTMTPGEIMRVLIEEAQTVGELTHISFDFTDSQDSAGVAWGTYVMDFAVPVGSSLLDVLRQLSEGAVDFAFDYSTNTLSMYRRGTLGQSRAVDLGRGDWVNLTNTIERARAKRVLAQLGNEVWTLVDSGRGGRLTTGFARLGTATSQMQAERVLGDWFSDHSDDRYAFIGQTLPSPGKVPYVDYQLGDRIGVPGWSESTPDWAINGEWRARVTTISVSEPPPPEDGTIGGTSLYVLEGWFEFEEEVIVQ